MSPRVTDYKAAWNDLRRWLAKEFGETNRNEDAAARTGRSTGVAYWNARGCQIEDVRQQMSVILGRHAKRRGQGRRVAK